MPWDSFRRKKDGSKRKDESSLFQQQLYHNQRPSALGAAQTTASSASTSSFASSTIVKGPSCNQVTVKEGAGHGVGAPWSSSVLTKEIVQKIREVENETSTLKSSSSQGLSYRIVESYEEKQAMPDGTQQTFVYQTIEVVKKPGQSLGLYLREGFGHERSDGVFVSRLADECDLAKSSCLKPGDEILSVNNVGVTQMGIDDVVVIISIPMRLLLKTRFPKFQTSRILTGAEATPSTSGVAAAVAAVKPVVVMKQIPREESVESGFTDDGGAPLAQARPTPTAQTSLGAKVRQQESRGPSYDSLRGQENAMGHHSTGFDDYGGKYTAYSRQIAMHTPRVLDSQGRVLEGPDIWHENCPGHSAGGPIRQPQLQTSPYQSTLSRTAYLPPPKLQSTAPVGAVGGARITSQVDYGPAAAALCSDGGFYPGPSPENVPELITQPPYEAFSELAINRPISGGLPQMPRSVLRQPSAFPMTGDSQQSDISFRGAMDGSVPPSSTMAVSCGAKSNSLPRRQAGRSIRWRNDVEGSGAAAPADIRHSMPLADYVEYDVMGDVVPTPMPLMPVYSTIRRPRQTKTVDDVFSRAEYQAWSVQPPPSLLNTSSVYDQQGPFGAFNPPMSDGRASYCPAGYQELSGAQFFGPQLQQQPYAMEEEEEEAVRSRFFTQGTMRHVAGRAPPPPGAAISPGGVQSSMQPRPPPRTLKSRSSSLPPRRILNELLRHGAPTTAAAHVDVSPLPNRRLPLKLAQDRRLLDPPMADPLLNPGIYSQSSPFYMQTGRRMVPVPSLSTLTGMLVVQIVEGRGLKARDCRHRDSENAEILEMYCVIEIDSEHRARTEVSNIETRFKWNETFEIDVFECHSAEFYIYSWHPQFRHKLKHRACLPLAETLLTNEVTGDSNVSYSAAAAAVSDLTGLLIAPQVQSFSLGLEPKGQLLVRLTFHRMMLVFRRHLAIRRQAYWGVPLTNIVDRENIPEYSVPLLLKRMIEEVERRGVDAGGLYTLCGSADKKNALKAALEHDPTNGDLGPDAVPDVNLITSLVKDFLRELPEPLIGPQTYQTLVEAWKVCLADDREGNAKLIFGVLDCLPRVNKCTLMVVVDHLKYLLSQSPHNGLHQAKLGTIFGPLMFCTSNQRPQVSDTSTPAIVIDFLDHGLAARLLEVILDLWPSRTSSSDSSGSENSTINLTSNGNRSLVDLWLQENRVPESNC